MYKEFIIENTEEIQLAEVDDFHELYMNIDNIPDEVVKAPPI